MSAPGASALMNVLKTCHGGKHKFATENALGGEPFGAKDDGPKEGGRCIMSDYLEMECGDYKPFGENRHPFRSIGITQCRILSL